jgi:predicted transposase YdaD
VSDALSFRVERKENDEQVCYHDITADHSTSFMSFYHLTVTSIARCRSPSEYATF